VIIQASVPVLPDDDVDSLAERVLEKEHPLYIQALRWFAEGRIQWNDGTLLFDGQPLQQPLQLNTGN